MTNTTAQAPAIVERKERDKYGRSVIKLEIEGEYFNTRVVIVRMPKVYIERYGKDQSYLVNDWQHPCYIDGVSQSEAHGKVTYVATLKEARAVAAAKIANPHPLSTR